MKEADCRNRIKTIAEEIHVGCRQLCELRASINTKISSYVKAELELAKMLYLKNLTSLAKTGIQ